MSLFKKPALIAAFFSVVIFGLSACGGDESASDPDKAEQLRGSVKEVASKAKETASEVAASAKDKASDVATKAKETASDVVERLEDKIKVPTNSAESDSE